MLHTVLASRSLICYLAAPVPPALIRTLMIIDSSKLMSLRKSLEGRHSEMVSLIRRLVEIETPSGDEQGSRTLNDQLESVARTIPSVSSVERIISPSCGEHLLIRAFDRNGNDDKPALILGHTDTVHPRGTLSTLGAPRIEAGRLYGPGAFDMKASCVVALEALRVLTTLNPPRRPVRLLLTCDEETGSATGRPLVEREAARAAHVLVLEPPLPGGCAKTSRKGVGQWKIAAQGIAAHAGLDPKAGASAILELARLTERLHSLNDSMSGISFNVGLIRGGTRGNVVAAQAEMEVDARFSTTDEARRVVELMRSLATFDERVSLTITGGVNRAPLERTAAVAGLFRHAQEIASQLGFNLGECSVGGASDGNFAAALNVPVLDGLGVDGDGAHAAHEHILLADIAPRTALLAGLLSTL
jgi:glutamate carboxypeptidase